MIGIFDSGVGGLTVVREVLKYAPKYQIIYFGDTARLPYGTKGEKFVKEYSEKITRWLMKKGAKLVIVACHTSSAWASDSLKRKFSAEGGSASDGKETPVFEMITPVLEEILKSTKNKKIGIIGTPGTIKSGTYKKKLLKLDPSLKIYSTPCPLFVPLVEEGWIRQKETKMIAVKYLQPLKEKGIDTLVLGCTHYPLLKGVIKEIMGNGVNIINPAESLAKELKLFLKNNPEIEAKIKKGSHHQFFFSDTPYHLKKISTLALGKEIKAKIDDPF